MKEARKLYNGIAGGSFAWLAERRRGKKKSVMKKCVGGRNWRMTTLEALNEGNNKGNNDATTTTTKKKMCMKCDTKHTHEKKSNTQDSFISSSKRKKKKKH